MWEVPSTPDVLISIGTIVAGAAALWGAFSAHRGLSSWKSQQTWTRDRELAKKLLVTIFERQDAVRGIRNPFGYISLEALHDREKRWEDLVSDYKKRVDNLYSARKAFSALENEARAIWGNDILDRSQSLKSFEAELLVEVEEYIESHNPIHERGEYFGEKEDALNNKNIVMARSPQRDEFGPKYDAAISEFEGYLRNRLTQ